MCTETLDLPSVPEPAELQRAPGAADSSQPRRSAPPDTYESATNPMGRAGEPAVRIGSILHRARCKSRRYPKRVRTTRNGGLEGTSAGVRVGARAPYGSVGELAVLGRCG